jgi:hypothetical protein
MNFRKKPVIVEAYQTDVAIKFSTLKGVLTAIPGDWVITGILGEQYPCKPDIFHKTYEPANERDQPITMNFRKKPVIVEAYQTDFAIEISTLEGEITAAPGDWVITGIQGEQYPCKPDPFHKTYELLTF